MNVQLMLTCLCDAFYGEVGIATTKVLEYLGCNVTFDDRQTCCGQPAFNSGDARNAKDMAAKWKSVFNPNSPVIVPSASCAAMVTEGFHMMGLNGLLPEVYELAQFIEKFYPDVSYLGLESHQKIAFHKSCHGRMIHLRDEHLKIFGRVKSLEVVPFVDADQCCGFGGSFSVKFGSVSRDIGVTKLKTLVDSGVTCVVGADMGCLMHLSGLATKQGMDLHFRHFSEVLSWAI